MADEVKEPEKKADMDLFMEAVDKILDAILELQKTVKEAIAEKEIKSRAGRF